MSRSAALTTCICMQLLVSFWAVPAPATAPPVVRFKPCHFPNFTQAVDHFSKIIQFVTVSDIDKPKHVLHEDEFAQLDAYLPTAYPEVWQQLHVEKVTAHRHDRVHAGFVSLLLKELLQLQSNSVLHLRCFHTGHEQAYRALIVLVMTDGYLACKAVCWRCANMQDNSGHANLHDQMCPLCPRYSMYMKLLSNHGMLF